MNGVDIDLNALLRAAAEIGVRKCAAELARPVFVHQRSVEQVWGVPGHAFLDFAHAGDFPTWKIRRLIFAETEAVVAFIKANVMRPDVDDEAVYVPRTAREEAEAAALARVGARRVSR